MPFQLKKGVGGMGSETIANSDDSRGKSFIHLAFEFIYHIFPHLDTIVSGITPTYPWCPSSELALFQAMIANKPAGELENSILPP